jgi:hypothetical protein
VVEEETARAVKEQRAARRRMLLGTLGILMILAIGGMGVAIWQWLDAEEARANAEKARTLAEEQRRLALEAAQSARQTAQAALQTYDTLKQGSSAAAPAAAQQLQQLQYRAQTELAVSNRMGAAASAQAPGVPSSTSAPLTPRAYIQVRSQLEAERAKQTLIPQLRNAGFTVPAPQILTTGPSSTEVRYFRPQENEGAERIVATMREAGIPNVQAKYVGGYENSQRIRQNHFEVWLAPAGSPETTSR